MTLNLSLSETPELKPKLLVLGVGGAGGNAVNNMINANPGNIGIEFWAANTDAQALRGSLAPNKIQLGMNLTKGLGAGSNPEIGKMAAEESMEELKAALEDCNMLFITAGMGGGTGTGAAPVIAKIASEQGILTVCVVTKPFHFEGERRLKIAELGLEELYKCVDTLIVIPNQNLFRIANEKTTFAEAFKIADDVLRSGVESVTNLITIPGLINLDFADIKAVMEKMGTAMMGTGYGSNDDEDRAIVAAEKAVFNPLLDDLSIKGAKGVLINITGGYDITLFEIESAVQRIKEEVDAHANVIFGSAFDENLQGIKISVVATGVEDRTKRYAVEGSENLHSLHTSVSQQRSSESDRVAQHPLTNDPYTGISKQVQNLATETSDRNSDQQASDCFVSLKFVNQAVPETTQIGSEIESISDDKQCISSVQEEPRHYTIKPSPLKYDASKTFNKVVANLGKIRVSEANVKEQESYNILETPAFLRRNKK